MAPVVCVLVKICVSSISFYKLDTDKLTTPFESAHQFTLVCTVSDSKTVPGCHKPRLQADFSLIERPAKNRPGIDCMRK